MSTPVPDTPPSTPPLDTLISVPRFLEIELANRLPTESTMAQKNISSLGQKTVPSTTSSAPTRRASPRKAVSGLCLPNSNRGGSYCYKRLLFGGSNHINVPLKLLSGQLPRMQCFFCRQGGEVATCSSCTSFAACFTANGFQGCIPGQLMDQWKCPKCLQDAGKPIPYAIPTLSVGGSRFGMSSEPLVIYNIYFDNAHSGNPAEASARLLESMCYGRYIGNPRSLDALQLKFTDLADGKSKKQIAWNRSVILEHQQSSRLIIIINTHANPEDGRLLYGSGKFASLDAILSHILDLSVIKNYRKSFLFLVTCGGFVKYALEELKSSCQWFSSAIAFGADSVDPLLVSTQFLFTLMDFHIFGCEPFDLAVHRAYKKEVASHTSVYIANQSQVGRLIECAWRRRPNGVDVRCCNTPAKYVATRPHKGKDVAIFRCREKTHPEGVTRVQYIEPLLDADGVRKIYGKRGDFRYMFEFV
ncbi:uncharacterized protein F5891DRAFT_1184718 [Suillus fuscotomentosus]|uniref:Uncharacterized protein n=1 Tax=Suillus fuscotomentosus TaxID=1912939 RepID=A0AAD4EF05_9AGAM|nr:uncharacterized protein F5891DRAFT_1184718 [Suillus fuscotomentosus]KAG1903769.1 hypothetical protein F5891DRAFT_1184718 [Suillus fuscotomentosus]